MKIRIVDHGLEQHTEIFIDSLKERIPVQISDEGMFIEFTINSQIGQEESYQISFEEGKWKIVGSDEVGLFYGIGKFLHTAKWSGEDFMPEPPTKVMNPDCTYRCIYFSVHAYNWYHMAPLEELEQYLKELLLWGYNTIHMCVPIFNTHHFKEELFLKAVEKTRSIYKLAKKLGMKLSFGIVPNQAPLDAPHEFDAVPMERPHPNTGRNICPSKPRAIEYLKEVWANIFEGYKDIEMDYFMFWPYDEGGCACEECKPWGANGYAKLCMVAYEEAKKLFPNAKFVVSTWLFDKPGDQGEFEGMYEKLKGEMEWVHYIMADAHSGYPEYPLEHDVIKPIINFPEISMFKLFPWGGFGANPLLNHFQEIWDYTKRIQMGGQPYSEGLYEDISKIQFIGYYWEKDRHWKDTLSEYINYEYEREVCEEVLELMELVEKNHLIVGERKAPDYAASDRAAGLAMTVDAKLGERAKTSWRWRILYIRAILDKKRYDAFKGYGWETPKEVDDLRHFSADYLTGDEEAQDLLKELRKLYHSVEFNGENCWTLPFVNGNTVYPPAKPLENTKIKRSPYYEREI